MREGEAAQSAIRNGGLGEKGGLAIGGGRQVPRDRESVGLHFRGGAPIQEVGENVGIFNFGTGTSLPQPP